MHAQSVLYIIVFGSHAILCNRPDVATNFVLFLVYQLIETFDGSREGSAEPQETTTTKGDDGDEALSELKQNRQRRGSLQILNVDTAEEEEETAPTKRKSDHAKQLRDHPYMNSTKMLAFFPHARPTPFFHKCEVFLDPVPPSLWTSYLDGPEGESRPRRSPCRPWRTTAT